jgi:hypothetical protein
MDQNNKAVLHEKSEDSSITTIKRKEVFFVMNLLWLRKQSILSS